MKFPLKRRAPIYLTGFLIGVIAVMMLTQAKKASAPDFEEVNIEASPLYLVVGGAIRLQLGKNPGHVLAWGFPTQLMVGHEEEPGRYAPAMRMEYRDLVEEETLIGPFSKPGKYELRAQFFACAFPGEKYCAKISVLQPVIAAEDGSLPRELPLAVDVTGAAKRASESGEAREEAAKKAALAPTP